MASSTEPEIILYDLACIRNACFSPVVWRIRLMLNYKRIHYKTVFLEFPDIEPTLKKLGIVAVGTKYTVPSIHHIPTNTYMMDSVPIAQFLESTYPDPPLTLTSELGREIESKARSGSGKTVRSSIMPREIRILAPRSQEYFRRNAEAAIGHRLEDLLDDDKEDRAWKEVADDMRHVGELLLTNKAKGSFILGSQPSITDFFITASLQSARMIDEGVFQRMVQFPGYGEIYEACQPFMDKRD